MKRKLVLIAFVLATQVAAKPASKSVAVKSSEQGASSVTPAAPIGEPAQWITSDDYPADALRSGATGVVNFTLAIDETGKVTDCSVTETSGNQSLDDATCALMMARARFSPARDRAGQPVAWAFHRRVNWQLPHASREIWTLDQIRFATPTNTQILSQIASDHSMDAVVKRLKSLGITFERGTSQLDTATIPEATVAQVNSQPKTATFVVPQDGLTTVNAVTVRQPADFDGTAAKPIPLPSPLSTQATITYDVDPDGRPSNCLFMGEAPLWMGSVIDWCKAMETGKANFAHEPKKQTRHVALTLQVSVTQSNPTTPPAQ